MWCTFDIEKTEYMDENVHVWIGIHMLQESFAILSGLIAPLHWIVSQYEDIMSLYHDPLLDHV